ncbi:hypothetical protein ACFE04_010748 [Oxalis oulophora]
METPKSEPPYSPSSFKQLIKNSFCIPCSFRKHHRHHHLHKNGDYEDDDISPRLTRTSSCSPKSCNDGVGGNNNNNQRGSTNNDHNQPPHHPRNRHHHENSLPGKCRNFFFTVRNGGGGGGDRGKQQQQQHSYMNNNNHHGRRHSADFRYDAYSYALNFDDDAHLDDCPLRSFSSRLPQSPENRNDQVTCVL